MTARARILQKPTLVQTIIKAAMTKLSIDDQSPDWEVYGERALLWWEEWWLRSAPTGISESKFAELCIERLREEPIWKKLLT